MPIATRMRMAAGNGQITPTPWWAAGGASGLYAAYSGLYVASKAASLTDLSGNGHTLTEVGTVGWAANLGWGSLSLTNYLDTSIAPVDGYTAIISFANGGASRWVMGAFDGSTKALTFLPGATGVLYWAGVNQSDRGAQQLTGVLALADAQPYRNGNADGADLGAWGGTTSVTMALGRLKNYGFDAWTLGQIRRFAYYDNQLTAGQVKAVSRAMHDYAVFFGDSITVGQGASDAAHQWVNLVAADQGWGTWLNSGISGTVLQNTTQNTVTTIGGAAANNGRDTYTTRVKDPLPNWVFILYGLNDLRLNDVAFTDANFQTDLGQVVAALIADGLPANHIIIGSPPYTNPSADGSNAPYDAGSTPKHVAYTTAALAVANAYGTRYADVYQAMIDNGGNSLVSGDGIHPNDSGHQVIADAFLAAL